MTNVDLLDVCEPLTGDGFGGDGDSDEEYLESKKIVCWVISFIHLHAL